MTLRAQWLGRELRRLREANGLRLKEVGEYLQRDGATVGRFEVGLYPARTQDVRALLDLYGVDDERRRATLIKIAGEVWQTDWWDSYSDDLDKRVIDYAWVESRARRISSYDALVVPGLLQTVGYMEALIQDEERSGSASTSGAEFRLRRQEILLGPEPPHIEALIDEGLLQRAPGGRAVLREQLEHLVKLAHRPTIDLRVLPFSATGSASLYGSFRIFEMSEPYPDVGYVETPVGGLYVETDGVERLKMKFNRIRRGSCDSAESIELIEAALSRLG
ncbi:helix-turn-helix transcriptional regulator [Thermopolyspora sp. NPDC052614]|uniref:helix-turn-helix domain-containing protein n=1 Tax=Thermopolyspora sp. NPDC052614 TaxID=3155682 RepID=UPI003426377D